MQCEYTSPSEPCKFCLSHGLDNCVKLLGPKSPSYSYDPVKSIDLVSNGSGRGSHIGSFVQSLPIPGHLTSHSPLQWAVLAWATQQSRRQMVAESVFTCIKNASRGLKDAIETGSFRESEVFASNLLGWVIYSTCSEEFDTRVHFKGSQNMLSCMARKEYGFRDDNILAFGPFIMDCANAWHQKETGMVPYHCTTFQPRVRYFNELLATTKWCTPYSGMLEAANATVGNMLEIALSCACRIARREAQSGFARESVLQYLRSEFGDSDFHATLLKIHSSFQGANQDHSTVEGQYITRLFHRVRAVLLLHSVLEADSIQKGVATEQSIIIGTKLLRHCQKQAIRRDGSIEDYFLISWHNYSLLLLGGLALSYETSADRTRLFRFRSNG